MSQPKQPDAVNRFSFVSTRRRISVFLGLAALVFAVLAFRRLAGEWGFYYLLFGDGRTPGVDMAYRQQEMRLWFSGANLLDAGLERRAYPPASYVMLYPFFGWLNFAAGRAVWALISIPLLGWLVYLTVRSSGSRTRLEKIFWLLLPLAMIHTIDTIRIAQPGLIVMTALWSAFYLIFRHLPSWPRDLAAAGLMILSLLKPQFSLPFFWILLIRWRGLRPLALTFVGYTALTLYAISFQDLPWSESLTAWLHGGTEYAKGMKSTFIQGLFIETGKRHWILYYAAALFFTLGIWLCRYRSADLWLLAGAAAIVARTWIFAYSYGELLMLIPLIALYRMLKQRTLTRLEKGMGAVLFILTLGVLIAPAPFFFPRQWWNIYFRIFYNTLWLTLFGYFWYFAQRETEPDPQKAD